jgi:hypothetical protein
MKIHYQLKRLCYFKEWLFYWKENCKVLQTYNGSLLTSGTHLVNLVTGFLLLNTTCMSVCTLCWPEKHTHKSNWDADNYPYNWGNCTIYFQMPIICFLRKSNLQITQLCMNSAADQHWRCWNTCGFLMFTRESSCTYMHSSFEFLHPKSSIEIFYRFQL